MHEACGIAPFWCILSLPRATVPFTQCPTPRRLSPPGRFLFTPCETFTQLLLASRLRLLLSGGDHGFVVVVPARFVRSYRRCASRISGQQIESRFQPIEAKSPLGLLSIASKYRLTCAACRGLECGHRLSKPRSFETILAWLWWQRSIH